MDVLRTRTVQVPAPQLSPEPELSIERRAKLLCEAGWAAFLANDPRAEERDGALEPLGRIGTNIGRASSVGFVKIERARWSTEGPYACPA